MHVSRCAYKTQFADYGWVPQTAALPLTRPLCHEQLRGAVKMAVHLSPSIGPVVSSGRSVRLLPAERHLVASMAS